MTIKDPQPPGDDPLDLTRRLATALREYPAELQQVKGILEPLLAEQEAGNYPAPVPLPEVPPEAPVPILQAAGQKGMILYEGGICLLAAESGVGKSSLTGELALATAMASHDLTGNELDLLEGELFHGKGGRCLIVNYEDRPTVTRWRIEKLANKLDGQSKDGSAHRAMHHIHVLDLAGWPLYGPDEGASYLNPTPQKGWLPLWQAVADIKPKIIIIDPALKAYTGGSNEPAPVRQFVDALSAGLRTHAPQAGILLTHHSTKASRSRGPGSGPGNPFDPGLIAGSGAWRDEARGALTMTLNDDMETLTLAIPKANYGPSQIAVRIRPVRDQDGTVIAFAKQGNWDKPQTGNIPAQVDPAIDHKVKNHKKNAEQYYADIGR